MNVKNIFISLLCSAVLSTQAFSYQTQLDGTPLPILLNEMPDAESLIGLRFARDLVMQHHERLLAELDLVQREVPEQFGFFIQSIPIRILHDAGLERCLDNRFRCVDSVTIEEIADVLFGIAPVPVDPCVQHRLDLNRTAEAYQLSPNEVTLAEYLLALDLFTAAGCSFVDIELLSMTQLALLEEEYQVTDQQDFLIEQAPAVFVLLLNLVERGGSASEVLNLQMSNLVSQPSTSNVRDYLAEVDAQAAEVLACGAENLLLCRAEVLKQSFKNKLSCTIWGKQILDVLIKCDRYGQGCDKFGKQADYWNRSKCATKQ